MKNSSIKNSNQLNVKSIKTETMKETTTNENLMNNNNQTQKQIMIDKSNKSLIEISSNYSDDELKDYCKGFFDMMTSKSLLGKFISEDKSLKELESYYEMLKKINVNTETENENFVKNCNQSQKQILVDKINRLMKDMISNLSDDKLEDFKKLYVESQFQSVRSGRMITKCESLENIELLYDKIKETMKETTNENLMNNSNQSQQETMLNKNRNLVIVVDKILLDILPDLVYDELKYMRKNCDYEYEDISEFLSKDYYYTESPLLRKLELLHNE